MELVVKTKSLVRIIKGLVIVHNGLNRVTALLEINVLLLDPIPLKTNLGLLNRDSNSSPPAPARKRKAKVEVKEVQPLIRIRLEDDLKLGNLGKEVVMVLVLLLKVRRAVAAARAAKAKALDPRLLPESELVPLLQAKKIALHAFVG